MTAGSVDPIVLAQGLIRCPSVTPAEGGALDLLQRTLEGLGFVCTRLPFSDLDTPDVDNLYARLGTTGRNFCFAGHTDVVPEGDTGAWTHNPFSGTIDESGMLHGRGAADMKGAVAAFTAAVSRFIARRGKDFGGSISFLITGDEEGPSVNGTVKMLDWLADQGETLDASLVGEPTNPRDLGDMIKIGRRGSLSGFITINGTQGHAAYPHLADNPVHRLLKVLARLVEPLDEGTDHFQPSSLQVTTVDVGNPATNVIPATAKATFNIRFNDLHTLDSLEAWAREILQEEAPDRFDLAVQRSGDAFLTPPGELSTLMADAVERVTGRRPELSTSGGTSDARFIKNFCPVAEFGLVGQTMHKVDERVPVETITQLTDIYEAILDGYFPDQKA
ncbi:succinyl-diaminopimelate desuccinylase [Magnetospira sp. QH-2]|uniref:succinyl-diaminopimelate desuccinylase n=1 Tax=Magnetospira sp. (strain QH-2) TaxID=1288970 RepID=UPI0003E81BF9|nr:succinyl-diaminopimelate desuccinylase [Magnetospira sp. QH-2]CCQ72211.1 Succinyl-diaminopimelate desuccinylase (SDAP) [Magnetospira sp. QH-2]